MSTHACQRCGYESRRPGGAAWADRHPAAVCAGVFVGLLALYTVAGVILAYPWFVIPLLVVVCAFVVDRRMRSRADIAARADYEYRQQMLAAVMAEPIGGPASPVPRLAPHRQGADHWSPTQPIRQNA